ncbi:MAG: hypothetical protein ACHP79_14300, partial [Terriglobales bacterium]
RVTALPDGIVSGRIGEIVARLHALHPRLIDLTLDRLLILLAKLGNPQLRLPPIIHVGGTNGKGSTCAFLRAMGEAAGKRVHVYTSPHLVRFNERIRVASELVTDAQLIAAMEAVEQANRESGEVVFLEALREPAALRDLEALREPAEPNDPAVPGKQPKQYRFSNKFECKNDGTVYQEPEPRLFSFNNPFGACPRCQGFGNTIDFDLNLVIPDSNKTLGEGAVEPWTKPKYRTLQSDLRKFAKMNDIPMDIPWADLDRDHQQMVLEGDGKFPGVQGFFSLLERKKYKLHVRVFLSRYRGYAQCPECGGGRLRADALQVKVEGKNIREATSLTVEQAAQFFNNLNLSREHTDIAGKILEQIQERLKYLNDVGLEYLTLDRLSSTLSGGEAQRIQLATSLGSRLVGALYVL